MESTRLFDSETCSVLLSIDIINSKYNNYEIENQKSVQNIV